MAKLAELQSIFNQAVFDNDSDSDALKAMSCFIEAGSIPADERMSIYRNSVYGCLINGALKKTFPATLNLLGEAFFSKMAEHYVDTHASENADIAVFGKGLPAFLQTFEPVQYIPYIAEVAKLEWLCHEAFVAADKAIFDIDAFGQLSASDRTKVVFYLAPDVKLIESDFPIDKIWQYGIKNDDSQAPPKLASGPFYCMVHRRDYRVVVEPLSKNEFVFLKEIATNTPFNEVCESISKCSINVGELLPKAIQSGWIDSYHT